MSYLKKVDHVAYAVEAGSIEKWAWFHIVVEGGTKNRRAAVEGPWPFISCDDKTSFSSLCSSLQPQHISRFGCACGVTIVLGTKICSTSNQRCI